MRRINGMKVKLILIIIVFVNLLSACSTRPKELDPTNYDQLLCAKQPPSSGSAFEYSHIRNKVLEDTALSLAAQGGLAWASQAINQRLARDKWFLESTYNFNGMMLSHGVLPPVLEEGNNSLNLADPSTIRVADKTYKIIQQARFATTPPNWREYLWMAFNKPEVPHKLLLPRNDEESKLWKKGIKVGWEKGIQQAYSIFQQNLARLKRDFKGMILYRKLLQERMISQPFVSRTELGVTGDGEDMRINDQVLRITALPKLQTESHCWKPIVVKQNDDP